LASSTERRRSKVASQVRQRYSYSGIARERRARGLAEGRRPGRAATPDGHLWEADDVTDAPDGDRPPADCLVMFGITGDLSKRRLFPALYRLEAGDRLGVPVVGLARAGWSNEQFRDHARTSIRAADPGADHAVVERLCARLTLVDGRYEEPDTFTRLAERVREVGGARPVFYLAIPPTAFEPVVQGLVGAGINRPGRVVVEKPFGRDLASAQRLNAVLHTGFDEEDICRIDHYLGKEAVEDLLVFRFANSFLEPIWNRNYVANVQVTLSETLGMEGRGAFYDEVGALRDVVQNHLLQIVCLLAMEPPVGPDSRHLQDEKAKVLAAMQQVDCSTMVRGQYRGYTAEAGVAPGSTTETFVALRFAIDSWRWAGVPFFARAGKGLAAAATEAVVQLKAPPRPLFAGDGVQPAPNLLRFRLGSDDGVTLSVQAKTPGPELLSESIDLAVDFADELGHRQDAYERLLGDALRGHTRRFSRQDVVEGEWRVVAPALVAPGPVLPYERGSWGPPQADSILGGFHWHDPIARG
jgi:glucose-6-phosphate 1-dehydrogenase